LSAGGGHSISYEEYNYSRAVGEQLGLRKLDICTGCGEGSMKGPMEGASIGHSKQRIKNSRYLGITEPKIIAVESPNPIVNNLVILPNIEQRLEAFVRIGHAVIVFPGGVGTTEEILYLIGILLHPDNAKNPFPLIFTGPKRAKEYFEKIDLFLKKILPPQSQSLYKIIINNPDLVAKKISTSITQALKLRQQSNNSPNFNWNLKIDPEFQQAFHPTHENMAKLNLSMHQEPYMLLANLRRAFSGIVSGNITEKGILSIKKHGNFRLSGDPQLMTALEDLLQSFAKQQRMSLQNKPYTPCYEIQHP
jgi:pyrimidine/purine-5'-nucleotide nucleosidase